MSDEVNETVSSNRRRGRGGSLESPEGTLKLKLSNELTRLTLSSGFRYDLNDRYALMFDEYEEEEMPDKLLLIANDLRAFASREMAAPVRDELIMAAGVFEKAAPWTHPCGSFCRLVVVSDPCFRSRSASEPPRHVRRPGFVAQPVGMGLVRAA